MTDDDYALIDKMKTLDCEKICVENKLDISSGVGKSFCECEERQSFTDNVVALSAKTGMGKEKLEECIRRLYNEDSLDLSSDAVIWSAAQKASLDRAYGLLSSAKEALEAGSPLDAVGVVCEEAVSELRMADGRDVSDEIIDGIFSKFCVGK